MTIKEINAMKHTKLFRLLALLCAVMMLPLLAAAEEEYNKKFSEQTTMLNNSQNEYAQQVKRIARAY